MQVKYRYDSIAKGWWDSLLLLRVASNRKPLSFGGSAISARHLCYQLSRREHTRMRSRREEGEVNANEGKCNAPVIRSEKLMIAG